MSEGGSSQSASGAFLPLPHTPGQNDHLFLGHTACQVTVYIGRDPGSQEEEQEWSIYPAYELWEENPRSPERSTESLIFS